MPDDTEQKERMDRFVESAVSAGASVERIPPSSSSLSNTFRDLLADTETVVCSQPDTLDSKFHSCFTDLPQVLTDPSDSELESSDAGLTEAFAGVARTGTVCIDVTRDLAGAVSLFPPVHVAVLTSDTIVPRPRDLFEGERAKEVPSRSNVTLISGPSATADMGPLVQGVHGPGTLHVILIDSGQNTT